MFHLSYSTPYKGEIKTLRLTRDPLRHGLGHYRDIEDTLWDVYGIDGRGERVYINARPVDHHLNYYGTHTGASNNGFHTWPPFYYEVVAEPPAVTS